MKRFIARFKSLPLKTRQLLILGTTLALVVALPLFIWAILTQRFELRKRAVTGEPTPPPPKTKKLRVIEVRYFPKGESEVIYHPDNLSQNLRSLLKEASSFHRYKDPGALPAIEVEVVDVINHNRARPTADGTRYEISKSVLEENNLCQRIRNEDIDQIWYWVDPRIDTSPGWEYVISSKYFQSGVQFATIANPAYCNGKTSFVLMGFDYSRTADLALHSFGHFLEGLLGNLQTIDLFWYRFAGDDNKGFPRGERCGNVHFPPNGIADYDYANQSYVDTYCEDWNPQGTGNKSAYNCNQWGCSQEGYLLWWMQNMPNMANNLTYQGKQLPSWWDFTTDMDASIARNYHDLNYFINRDFISSNQIPPLPEVPTTPVPTTSPTPTPIPRNPISAGTPQVSLQADNFYIIANGKTFYADPSTWPINVDSDPGTNTYTTFEMDWQEHGVSMRLYMYFRSDGTDWWAYEIRTYNGQPLGPNQPNDIYYRGEVFRTRLGQEFTGNIELRTSPNDPYQGVVHFDNLRLQAFTNLQPTPSPIITPTPMPAIQLMKFRIKLAGVTNDSAEGAKITVRFLNDSLKNIYGQDIYVNLITPPLPLIHLGEGIYETGIGITNPLPVGPGYTVFVKGEKHLARKFCASSGQSQRCVGPGGITISAAGTSVMDFTGLALEPGDLPPQDGKADSGDFAKIISLFTKLCSALTKDEKKIADLDYNGCVNIGDAFLMRKTLETKYDEF